MENEMDEMHDPREILKHLNYVENNFPIYEWKVNELRVWPFVRTSIAYTQNQHPILKKKKEKGGVVKKYLKYFKSLVELSFQLFNLKKQLKGARRLFVGASTHRIAKNDLKINRYFDIAVKDFQKEGEKAVIFDRGLLAAGATQELMNGEAVFSLPALYMLLEVKQKLLGRGRDLEVSLPNYDEVFSYLKKSLKYPENIKKQFEKSAVEERAITLYKRKTFLKNLLEDSKVEHAYFLCYYSSLLYPLVVACNELGIKTTDIQHGGMGPGHYSYDKWVLPPGENFLMLPKYFWTWDQNSALMINKWALQSDYHKAIPAGNPWNDAVFSIYDVEEDRGYILLNLTEVFLDPFIIEAIRYFGKSKRWKLRLHPRTLHRKDILEEQLKKENIESFTEIQDSINVPLPIALSNCDYFISKSSGSVIEAVELGLVPLLLRSVDFYYYEHYAADQQVKVLAEDNSENLIAYLNSPENIIGSVVIKHMRSSQRYSDFEMQIAKQGA